MGDPMIEWQYVDSSNVEAIRYCSQTSELHVRFIRGAEYVYYDVEENVAVGLLHATSVGKYLNQYIKGRYRYARR